MYNRHCSCVWSTDPAWFCSLFGDACVTSVIATRYQTSRAERTPWDPGPLSASGLAALRATVRLPASTEGQTDSSPELAKSSSQCSSVLVPTHRLFLSQEQQLSAFSVIWGRDQFMLLVRIKYLIQLISCISHIYIHAHEPPRTHKDSKACFSLVYEVAAFLIWASN